MAEKYTVLIVDDSPDIIMVLNDYLQEEYLVKVANSGDKALRIAETQPQPDLVLLDVMMPGVDGYAVCLKLKENEATRNIPVLFISAVSDNLDVLKAFQIGGVDYITKPFQPAEVMARVKTHLELHRTRQDNQTLKSKTLPGSVRMMIDLLSLTQPHLLAQSNRIRRYAMELTKNLKISPQDAWNIELATMMAALGCAGIAPDILRRWNAGQKLSSEEMLLVEGHPGEGADMLSRIPQLEIVAEIIRNQNVPVQKLVNNKKDITYLGSAMLNMLLAFDKQVVSGKEPAEAVAVLREQPYPTYLLEGLNIVVSADTKREAISLPFCLLRPEMVLAEDLMNRDGGLVVSKGSELSASRIRLLNKFVAQGNCRNDNLLVWKPS